MILLLGGEKGGTGKTTLAVNLAALIALSGKDVLLIDTDRQGSANFWASIRDESGALPRIPCVQKFGKSLAKDVIDLAGRYEEIVIDAGGRDSMELRYSLGVADRVYIPIQPSQFDLVTLDQMDRLVEQAQALNPGLESFVVINRASTNPTVTDTHEAVELVSEFEHLTLADTILRERVAYQRSVREGLSVAEVPHPDYKAVTEMSSLYKEMYHVQIEATPAEAFC
jgi:chromosome partitioning protein